MAEATHGRRLGRPALDEAVALRETFLDQAFVMLCERGVHGLSMDALAKASGVTKRTIYRQYKSKSVLIEAVVEREAIRFTNNEDLFSQVNLSPVERLRLWGLRIFQYLNRPETVRLSLLLKVASLTESWAADMLSTWVVRIVNSANALVAAAQESGELRRCDPETLTLLLLDLIDGAFGRMRQDTGIPIISGDADIDKKFQYRWIAFLQLARLDWSMA